VPQSLRLVACAIVLACCLVLFPSVALADADENPTGPAGPDLNAGLQPIAGQIPLPRTLPGESRLTPRIDGVWVAIPSVSGTTKTFHLTARRAPWALNKTLRVYANTYNGVVPGPALIVNEGDEVVIDYRNGLDVPDTIHLHGIHGGPVDMDGVAGISQPMVPPGGSFRYVFRASQPGTFIYHTHDNEAMLDSGLYGAIVVLPKHPRPEERVDRDDLEIISSWQIQSTSENHFTINGREYPATWPIEVEEGQRVRIRWVNISGETMETMRIHGHDQHIIARDAQPVAGHDVEDTIVIGPGQRIDVVITADRKPGNWLVESDVLAHTEDMQGLPDGLITEIHYGGEPYPLSRLPLPAAVRAPINPLLYVWAAWAAAALAGALIVFGTRRLKRRK